MTSIMCYCVPYIYINTSFAIHAVHVEINFTLIPLVFWLHMHACSTITVLKIYMYNSFIIHRLTSLIYCSFCSNDLVFVCNL